MINGVTANGAAPDSNNLRQFLQGLEDQINQINKAMGSQTGNSTTATPADSSFKVTNKDGVFIIDITTPQGISYNSISQATQKYTNINYDANPVNTSIFYQLQSCLTVNFDADGEVATYGGDSGDTKLHWEVRDPNVTKFWRFRSKYQNSDWSKWILWQDPLFCGAIAVWSGLLKTESLSWVNSAAQTTDGSNALSQDGVTTNILVASKKWNVGPQQITYNAGSIDPGIYGPFYVYGIDEKKVGGAITYLATQNTGDLTAKNGIVVFGKITTAAGGGGTGTGGGSCHVLGTQVEMYNGGPGGVFKDVSEIIKGDQVLGTDGGIEEAQADAEPVANVPCFSLEFSNGVIVQGVSSTEPIMLAPGNFLTVFEAIVGQMFQTRAAIATLNTKTFIGNRTVWRLRLSRTKTFWADGLGSHNLKIL